MWPTIADKVCQKNVASDATHSTVSLELVARRAIVGAMNKTPRTKKRERDFVRWSSPDPSCPIHNTPMILTSMPRPAWTLFRLDEQKTRSVWRCPHQGCGRVEFNLERDSQLVAPDAPAPAPASRADVRRVLNTTDFRRYE